MADSTFIYRACIGVGLFVLLGWWDYHKHPENPKRLKEYVFLFGITAATMVYGIVHDFVTWSISRDYFVLAKGILSAETHFGWPMMRLAMLATWNVGLVGAVILLLSNNPDKHGRQVTYRVLLKLCLIPLIVSVVVESIAGIVAFTNVERFQDYLPIELLAQGADDRLIAVWGMHWAAYIGAGLGVIVASVLIIRKKRTLPEQTDARHKGWTSWLKLG